MILSPRPDDQVDSKNKTHTFGCHKSELLIGAMNSIELVIGPMDPSRFVRSLIPYQLLYAIRLDRMAKNSDLYTTLGANQTAQYSHT